jgi:hypothetical protein
LKLLRAAGIARSVQVAKVGTRLAEQEAA